MGTDWVASVRNSAAKGNVAATRKRWPLFPPWSKPSFSNVSASRRIKGGGMPMRSAASRTAKASCGSRRRSRRRRARAGDPVSVSRRGASRDAAIRTVIGARFAIRLFRAGRFGTERRFENECRKIFFLLVVFFALLPRKERALLGRRRATRFRCEPLRAFFDRRERRNTRRFLPLCETRLPLRGRFRLCAISFLYHTERFVGKRRQSRRTSRRTKEGERPSTRSSRTHRAMVRELLVDGRSPSLV